jgi:hypothetical protein
MKVAVSSRRAEVSGRFGPMCIACGNTRRFWVSTPNGEQLAELHELGDGEARIVACGRCRTRHSVVIARVD